MDFFRVLCETVKDFVSKVGTASANSDPSQADEPDSLTQKVSTLHKNIRAHVEGIHVESKALSGDLVL